MRGDAVTTHHWLTARAFVAVVAIGQLTPGPVVATVAAVGFAAGGFVDGALAAGIAFTPSLVMVGLGARHLDRLRTRPNVRSFLDGAGPVAAGAIGAAAVVLARACSLSWQWPLVVWAVVAVVWLRRSPTLMLTAGAATGLLLALVAHVPVS
jgi:chromate transporter